MARVVPRALDSSFEVFQGNVSLSCMKGVACGARDATAMLMM